MNDETTSLVTDMAAALMMPSEIAILIDINPDDAEYFVKNKPDNWFTIAYMKGRLKTKLDLRKKIVQLAKAGSPQAELLADKYLNLE